MSRTYVITGANRGIGLQFATVLSSRGDRVIATARKPEDAAELARLKGVRVLPLDVSSESSIAHFGQSLAGQPVDVLINNAGVSAKGKSVESLDVKEFRDVFMVNTFAPMLVTRAILPSLRAGKTKTIVQITSQLASITNNTGGSTYAYRASKAGLNMLNRSLANELQAEGFTCVAMHPGWVQTDMGGKGADLTVQQAVDHMVRVMDGLQAENSGTFLNYDGKPLPW